MKHEWLAEHKEVALTQYDAELLLGAGFIDMNISVYLSDWVVCEICGALLREETLEQECPENED